MSYEEVDKNIRHGLLLCYDICNLQLTYFSPPFVAFNIIAFAVLRIHFFQQLFSSCLVDALFSCPVVFYAHKKDASIAFIYI